jgi:beta-galactosidase/beta-glucuronidase
LVKATMDWQSQGHSYQGTAWYRKKMNIAQKEQGKKYLLFFGAVDGDAAVFVNGEKVGEHLLGPGYANYDKEFMIDITQVLKSGDNTIVVKVTKDFAIGGITKGVSLVQM